MIVETEAISVELYQLLTEVFHLLDDTERRILRQHNLSIAQFNALYHVDTKNGLSINDLTTRLICDKSNTTRIVDRLRNEDLVIRQRDKTDRRYVSVRLTEAGESLRQEALITLQASLRQRFAVLSSQEQTGLNQLLMRLRDSLREQLNLQSSAQVERR